MLTVPARPDQRNGLAKEGDAELEDEPIRNCEGHASINVGLCLLSGKYAEVHE